MDKSKKIMFFSLLSILFLSVVIIFIVGVVRTNMVQNDPRQKTFLAGKVPSKMPDGLHKGSAPGYNGSWQGKKFDAKAKTGINLFKNGDKTSEQYSFKTYVAKGVQDDMEVIKIDYNIPENPWNLRLILDEIVETKPGTYLGKLHVTLIPGLPFTVMYFNLEK